MPNLSEKHPSSQDYPTQQVTSPLDRLIEDLKHFRHSYLVNGRRRRSAVLAGMILILLNQYRIRPLSRTKLQRFLYWLEQQEAA